MRKLSSQRIFVIKKISPIVVAIFSVFFMLANAVKYKKGDLTGPFLWFSLLFPCLIIAITFWRLKLSDPILDEVFDGGDYLLLKRDRQEDTVPFSEIKKVVLMKRNLVSLGSYGKSFILCLTLKTPGRFGETVMFMPAFPFFGSGSVEPIQQLLDKVRQSSDVKEPGVKAAIPERVEQLFQEDFENPFA
jgi:hypothetical protein